MSRFTINALFLMALIPVTIACANHFYDDYWPSVDEWWDFTKGLLVVILIVPGFTILLYALYFAALGIISLWGFK